MMFSVDVEATNAPDAWDIAERRARDSGRTVIARDEIRDLGRAGNNEMHLWWVRLKVVEP